MNNKGFTLIELIVTLVISSFVCLSIIVLVQLCLRNQLFSDSVNTLQIESQIVKGQISNTIQSCDKYYSYIKDSNNILEVYAYNLKYKKKVYYTYLFLDDKTYVRVGSDSYSSDDINFNINDFEILSDCCSSIIISPSSYDCNNASEDFDGNVSISINMNFNNEDYQSYFIQHIRGYNK